MKNKRNTRRGRAKRWKFNGDFWWWYGQHGLAWCYYKHLEQSWYVALRRDGLLMTRLEPNRAAAMRTGEELVRRMK